MAKNLKDLLKRSAQGKDSIFFPIIRFNREKAISNKIKLYSWEANDFKIYPSSLSFDMCPYTYIQEDVHKYKDLGIDISYRAEVGKYLHQMFQDESKDIPDLLWEKPNVPDDLKVKLDTYWPEVPIWDKLTGISGRADLVLNNKGKPVVFDIKTTSVQPSSWEYTISKLPSDYHKCQVCIYIYYMNKYKYYDVKIEEGRLGYVNLLLPAGASGSEVEVSFKYTDELEQAVELLIEHLIKEKTLFLNKKPSSCTYPNCKLHKLTEDNQ